MATPLEALSTERKGLAALLWGLARTRPLRTALVLGLLVLAGLAETIGVAALLPLLTIFINESPRGDSALAGAVSRVIEALGLRPTVGVVLLVIVVGISGKAAVVAVAMRHVGHATASFAADLRLMLIRGLMTARWSHFTERPLGSFANAMSGEVIRASGVYFQAVVIAATVIHVVVYAALALMVSWQATLFAILIGSVMIGLLRSLVQLSRHAGEQQTLAMKALTERLADGLSAIKPLKAMAREQSLQPLLEAESHHLDVAQKQQATSSATLVGAQEGFIVATLGAGMYVAITRLGLPLESFLFMGFLFLRLVGKIGELQTHYQRLVEYESALWSFLEIAAEARKARETGSGTRVPDLQREIRFENVDFSYGVQPIIRDLSLAIPAKRFTAIIGPSGIGKTSLVDLISGLQSATGGEIWIDDDPLAEVDLKAWRSKIGYVPQEVVLFHESVDANVALKDPSISRSDTEAALRAAGAWEFVQQLPSGIDTPVGERGLRLSGGQRQRIAIARALVREPELLILDEATTGLDPETEHAICAVLRQLSERITIVAISHQPTLVGEAHVLFDLGSPPLSDHMGLAVPDWNPRSVHEEA